MNISAHSQFLALFVILTVGKLGGSLVAAVYPIPPSVSTGLCDVSLMTSNVSVLVFLGSGVLVVTDSGIKTLFANRQHY